MKISKSMRDEAKYHRGLVQNYKELKSQREALVAELYKSRPDLVAEIAAIDDTIGQLLPEMHDWKLQMTADCVDRASQGRERGTRAQPRPSLRK